MRGATQCARRLRTLLDSLRSKLGKVSLAPVGDPITQMVLGILSRDTRESKAREALNRIRGMVVDYNELRVIPPIELAETVGDYLDARLKCEDISRALNGIFALNHVVSLDHLTGMSSKEVRLYLAQLDGLEAYTQARVRLLALQQHAIPLDEAMWAYARRERIVDARCPLAEAQAFLERQVAPQDALEFVALLRRQAWTEMGDAVQRSEVARIRSTPPDRTARNMLQLVGGPAQKERPANEVQQAPAKPDRTPARKRSPVRRKRAARRTLKKTRPRRKAKAAARTARPSKAKKSAKLAKKRAPAKTKSARAAAKPKSPPAGSARRGRKAKAKASNSTHIAASRSKARAKSA